MSALVATREERRAWLLAAGLALAAHGGVAALVLAWVRPAEHMPPEPVVLVELPPEAAAAAAPSLQEVQPQVAAIPQPTRTPPLDVPPAPLPPPASAVTLPPPASTQPARHEAATAPVAAPPAPAPAVAATPTVTSAATGTDPRAKRQEADYFALVSAHLNRRKVYPAEARQARQQGVVTVRFTVDRSGAVSNVSIKRGSGHAVLDRATLDLLQRVAPLPRMPATMARDSVTLSLPIDYSLRTS